MAEATHESGRNRKLVWWVKVIVPILALAFTFLGVLTPLLSKSCSSSSNASNPPPSPTMVRGRVLNSLNLAPVADAQVEIELSEGVQPTYTDSRGVFQLELPASWEGVSFRLRVQAEGFELYLQETTVDLSGSRLNDIRLIPVATGLGTSRDASGATLFPLVVEVVEGDGPRAVSPLGAVLSVRFMVQEGRQTAVLTLLGQGVRVSKAFFGPGAAIPIDTAAGSYEMSLLSWDLRAGKATVAFNRIAA